MRAELDRPHTPDGDPDAQRRLCAGLPPTDVRHPGIIARTHFFDEQLLIALHEGIRQIVICGAGYDDRAIRFRSPGVRYFELDHPLTQGDKAERLRTMQTDTTNLLMIPIDFTDRDVSARLVGAGHDGSIPTLFLCEGLLVYFDRTTGDALVSGLRSRAAPGSTLVASLATHTPGVESARAVEVANARRRDASREPWRTILPADVYREVIGQCGWRVDQFVDAAALEPGAAEGRTLLVAATVTAS